MSRDEVVRADGTTEVRVRHGGALAAATIMALAVAFYGGAALVVTSGGGARTPTATAEEGDWSDLLVAIQWQTLGDSSYAMFDSANSEPLRNVFSSGRSSSIETAASLSLVGWPTTNAYYNVAEWTGEIAPTSPLGRAENYGYDEDNSPIPTLTVGQSLYQRVYFQCIAEDRTWVDNAMHPWEDGSGGGSEANFAFRPTFGNSGTCDIDFRALEDLDYNPLAGPTVNKNTTYRLEYQQEVVYIGAVDSMRVHIAVYDSLGTQIADDSDFCDGANCLDSNPVIAMHPDGVEKMRGIKMGENDTGVEPNITEDLPFFIWGAWCIRTADWCGAYSAANEAGGP